MDVCDASYYINTKIMKIKVAKWGTPTKLLKNYLKFMRPNYPNYLGSRRTFA
jgi:hypothetical protein